MGDEDAVRATNRAFYEAFEARDLDAMSQVWEHSDRATCTHPGWATLRGWAQVAASFFALFQNGQRLQFILTEERAEIAGDTAWVCVDENILDSQTGTTVAAVNVFARHGGPSGTSESGERSEPSEPGWRMVVHHASVVNSSAGESTDE
jgi:ketosteroid isomerase-like protein